LTGEITFRLEYGQEVSMPMYFIVPSLHFVAMIDLTDSGIVEEIISHLLVLEEDQFIAGFHQQVQKAREKKWHDRKFKHKNF
jgi:hypothetical protein